MHRPGKFNYLNDLKVFKVVKDFKDLRVFEMVTTIPLKHKRLPNPYGEIKSPFTERGI